MENSKKLRLGVLGSGRGSNFVAIAEACRHGTIPAELAVVVSDQAGAGILEHARRFGCPAEFIEPGKFRTKLDESAETKLIETLQKARVDLVVLAGFMRILKGEFLRIFSGRVINIHPSLLPSFPGLEAWRQALEHGVKITGCTVHFVDHGIDTGAILAQAAVPVLPDDIPESLHARIHEAEHRLYPEVIGKLARQAYEIRGRQVRERPST